MKLEIDKLKGIHPGILIGHLLKKNSIKKKDFSLLVNEHPQTLSAIILGRRAMNTSLSIKIEKEFDLPEGLLMCMQVYYDINQFKKNTHNKPNVEIFSKVLFWDTKIENIDWVKHKKYVIQRVFARGNEQEIKEIIRFYGKETIIKHLNLKNKFEPNVKINAKKFLNYEETTLQHSVEDIN